MKYTEAKEAPDTEWSLSEFIVLHGNFTIIQEYETGLWYGIFSNRGIRIYTHIEKKIRGIPITTLLDNQDNYKVFVVYDTYCLKRKNDTPDYAAIWDDLHPFEQY